MLLAILIVACLALAGIVAVLWMLADQRTLAKEMYEADLEIVAILDRIEAAVGTVKPDKKER